MLRVLPIAVFVVTLLTSPAMAHEIHVSPAAATDPYAPYAFIVGDWAVSKASGGAPFVTLKARWATNHAYILYGAYIAEHPHFEGMLMWNGVHHNLDTLIATDMDHGLAQEAGTMTIVDGTAVSQSIASYSAGVSAGGSPAGPNGNSNRTRQTMKPIDADHIALSFEVETRDGWKPMVPGGDHLLMTRIK